MKFIHYTVYTVHYTVRKMYTVCDIKYTGGLYTIYLDIKHIAQVRNFNGTILEVADWLIPLLQKWK